MPRGISLRSLSPCDRRVVSFEFPYLAFGAFTGVPVAFL